MHHLTRAAATAVAALALVAGTGAASLAKPPAHAGPPSHAAVCKAQKAEAKAAKAALKEARKADRTRGVKVAKAERHLEKQQRQASSACSAAKKAAEAIARAEANLAGYEALLADPALEALPASLRDALVAAIGSAQAHVVAVVPEIDGAGTPELAHLVANLRALDPVKLADAVVALATELQGADPALLEWVEAGLAGVVEQLAAYDVAGNAPLKAFAGTIRDLVELLQTGVPGPVVEEPVVTP